MKKIFHNSMIIQSWFRPIYIFLALILIASTVLSACSPSTAEPTGVSPTMLVTLSPTLVPTNPPAHTQTLEPTVAPTNTLVPTIPPTTIPATATLAVPTAAPRDFSGYPDCKDVTEKIHPDSGLPLKDVDNPYPGVIWEGQIFAYEDCVFNLDKNFYALAADWLHGKTYDPNTGELLDGCPTGEECEGVSVFFRSGIIPAGNLVHLFVYPIGTEAVSRFLGTVNIPTAEREWSFACEYLEQSNKTNGEGTHDNSNIRVPVWAKDFASIFYHTGCIDFAGEPGYDNPIPAATQGCQAPTSTGWLWVHQGFWVYQGSPTSFVVPVTTVKVLYRDNSNEYLNTVAMTGQSVTDANYAYAYCK